VKEETHCVIASHFKEETQDKVASHQEKETQNEKAPLNSSLKCPSDAQKPPKFERF